MENQYFAAGEPIFAAGEEAQHVFWVLSGEVEVRHDDYVAVVKNGHILGEAALLGRTRTMSAYAKSDCALLSLTRAEILQHLTKDPDLALQIIDALFTKLANTTDELMRLKANTDHSSQKTVANRTRRLFPHRQRLKRLQANLQPDSGAIQTITE
jgi:CRP-like cAMP-binding protein